MKKTAILTMLGLTTVGQAAVIIDNFDSLALGSVNQLSGSTPNPTSGWFGTADFTTTGAAAVVADPFAPIVATDQALRLGSTTGGHRGVYKGLGSNAILQGSTVTLSFLMASESTTSTARLQFGIGNSTSNPTNGGFNQFEASVFFQGSATTGGTIYATAAGGTPVSLGSYTADTWYAFDMVVNNTTDTYDVFVNGASVGTGISFRNGVGTSDLDKITYWTPQATSGNTTGGHLDNITMIPEPSALALLGGASAAFCFIRRRSR